MSTNHDRAAALVKPNSRSWTADQVDRMCAMLRQGLNGSVIAERLGVGRGAVRGQIYRMQMNGDPGVPPVMKKGRRTSPEIRAQINALAEAVANGAPTIAAAGRMVGLTQQRADQHWLSIRRELGPQAV